MKYNKELLNRFLNNRLMVAVRTYKEWDQFMQLLEEETDATWYGVEKPTTFNEWFTYEKDSIIICGEIEKSELSFDTANDHPKDGIVEFKELIKGEEEMEYTGQNYRDLFVKTKIENFVKSQWNFKERYTTYKGFVNVAGCQLEEYLDFLYEMKSYGIERDEIEQIIIKDYLSDKEESNE